MAVHIILRSPTERVRPSSPTISACRPHSSSKTAPVLAARGFLTYPGIYFYLYRLSTRVTGFLREVGFKPRPGMTRDHSSAKGSKGPLSSNFEYMIHFSACWFVCTCDIRAWCRIKLDSNNSKHQSTQPIKVVRFHPNTSFRQVEHHGRLSPHHWHERERYHCPCETGRETQRSHIIVLNVLSSKPSLSDASRFSSLRLGGELGPVG